MTQKSQLTEEELPGYLQAVIDEAREYYCEGNVSVTETAVDIATDQPHLTAPHQGDHDNIEVLSDLREAGYLCCDELNTYRAYALSYDGDEATIEALVIRSLEELLHEALKE